MKYAHVLLVLGSTLVVGAAFYWAHGTAHRQGPEISRTSVPGLESGVSTSKIEDPGEAKPTSEDERLALPPVRSQSLDSSPVPENPGAEIPEDLKGIESETDPMRVRWRVLRYELQDYRSLPVKDPMGPREGSVVCDSVITILELSGRGTVPDPSRSMKWEDGEYYVIHNDRAFSWGAGEFPEWDAWREHMRDSGAYAERRDRKRARGQPFDESPPVFDPINFELIEARAEEAIALLESRFGFKATKN